MADLSTTHLRIHRDGDTESTVRNDRESKSLDRLCQQFEAATGWPLRLVSGQVAQLMGDPLWSAPLSSGDGTTADHLVIAKQPQKDHAGAISLEAATPLAEAMTEVADELIRSRRAIESREMELAAAMSVGSRGEDAEALARRLTAVLQGGAEAVDCQAAGVYLLDGATTELKLRGCWGLPPQRLLDPARPLQGAIADIEALAGSAVVLDTAGMAELWRAPESYGSAVCVPVASATTILGTLWMYADETRDFTDQQTNLIEIIAGRIAVELEREALLSEGQTSIDAYRQLDAAASRQQGQLPQTAPDIDGVQLQAVTEQAGELGGAFHDWAVLADDRLTLAVGSAPEQGTAAAFTSQIVRSTVRALTEHVDSPAERLGRVNETLWRDSLGDQFASAMVATLDGASGMLRYAMAGQCEALLLRADGWQSLAAAEPTLGCDAEIGFTDHELQLLGGDVLVAWSAGREQAPHRGPHELAEQTARVAEALMTCYNDGDDQLLATARREIEHLDVEAGTAPPAADRSVLVLRYER